MPDTGWEKEFPKVDGVYWTRLADDDTDLIPVRVETNTIHEFGVGVGFREHDYVDCEFLGPISPSDSEQLVRLREVAEKALDVLDLAEAALKAAVPYCAGDLEIALTNERERQGR